MVNKACLMCIKILLRPWDTKMQETIIISLGGSLIVPEEIDTEFISGFAKVLREFPNFHFVIAPGGGKTARKYGTALSVLGDENSDDLDWLGIYAIRLNSLLLSFVLKDFQNVTVIKNPDAKPGQTSDTHAVAYAKENGAKTIINLSNIDYVYNKNPKEFNDARPLKDISWAEFRKILGNEWVANTSWPFDPRASEVAEGLKLKVVFMNGKPIDNFKNYLAGKNFTGTTIS